MIFIENGIILKKLPSFGGIYSIKIDNYFFQYIGSTRNFYQRHADHMSALKNNKHGNKYLQNLFNKYGEDLFYFELLERIDNKYELSYWEQRYLDYYGLPNLINIRSVTGTFCPSDFKITEETRTKIGISSKKMWESEEYREKRKILLQSEEYREKMRTASKNFWSKEENKIKQSETLKSRWLNKEFRLQKSRRVSQFTLSGEYIQSFETIKNAALLCDTFGSNIVNCCKGKQKTASGFIWRYADDLEKTK